MEHREQLESSPTISGAKQKDERALGKLNFQTRFQFDFSISSCFIYTFYASELELEYERIHLEFK